MKIKHFILLGAFAVCGCLFLSSCKPDDDKARNPQVFTGKVVTFQDGKEVGLPEAKVEIGRFKATTKSDGTFSIQTDSATRYVVNIRKEGFALNSRIQSFATSGDTYYLYPATVVSIDPSAGDVTVTDKRSKDRPGPPSRSAEWSKYPLSQVPFVYKDGKLIDFGFSPELQAAMDYANKREPGSGASVTIKKNSLVSSSGKNPSGKINVAISTIDLFSQDGMPGDFSIASSEKSREQQPGYMISSGAVSIDIYDAKESYQLAKNQNAVITVPVDPSQLLSKGSVEPTIDLFYYDEKKGSWIKDGVAKLNDDGTAYVGTVKHFSTFNMDIEKTDPSCLSFRYAGTTPMATYKVQALIPKAGSIIPKLRTVTEPATAASAGSCLFNNGTSRHMLYNLPQATEMALVYFDAANVPLSINVLTSGSKYTVLPNCAAGDCAGAGAACDPSSLGICDDLAATCIGYADGGNVCTYQPFTNTNLDKVVAVATKMPSSKISFKWVAESTVTGTISFSKVDNDNLCGTNAVPISAGLVTNQPNVTINGGLIRKEVIIDISSLSFTGDTVFKIQIGSGATGGSACANPITLP